MAKDDPFGPGVQVEDRGIGEHQQDQDENHRQDRDVRPLACELLLVGQLVGRRADVMLVVVRRERIGELARAFVGHTLS